MRKALTKLLTSFLATSQAFAVEMPAPSAMTLTAPAPAPHGPPCGRIHQRRMGAQYIQEVLPQPYVDGARPLRINPAPPHRLERRVEWGGSLCALRRGIAPLPRRALPRRLGRVLLRPLLTLLSVAVVRVGAAVRLPKSLGDAEMHLDHRL